MAPYLVIISNNSQKKQFYCQDKDGVAMIYAMFQAFDTFDRFEFLQWASNYHQYSSVTDLTFKELEELAQQYKRET